MALLLEEKKGRLYIITLLIFFLQVWINQGDIILLGLRDYQDKKADVILKYNADEARNLKSYGEIPESGKKCLYAFTSYGTFHLSWFFCLYNYCMYYLVALGNLNYSVAYIQESCIEINCIYMLLTIYTCY